MRNYGITAGQLKRWQAHCATTNFKQAALDLEVPYRKLLDVVKHGHYHVLPRGGVRWKHEGKVYRVYEDGRVYSHQNNRWLTPEIDKDGYSIVWIGDLRFKLHRLLLTVFIRPPKSGEVSRHRDGNTSNNHVRNLEWGTTSDNERDKWKHGTHNKGSRHGRSVLKEAVVVRLRRAAMRVSNKRAFYEQKSSYLRDKRFNNSKRLQQGNLETHLKERSCNSYFADASPWPTD